MTWNIRGVTIVAPKITDPRLFMTGVLILYTSIGETILAFDHQWTQIATSLLVACTLDVILNYVRTKQIIIPISGVISGLGLGLLIESIPLWPFIVAPILAISSKSLLRVRGRHIFNPSNFGLTMLLLLFPQTVTTLAAQWSGSLLIVMVILVIGGFTSFRVSRWDLVISFVLSFCLMAVLENLIRHSGYVFAFGPLLGAAFQLFILSMITDPKTTPDTRRMRILFGFSLAVIDGILRLMDNQYSPFIALLIVSACVPVIRLISDWVTARSLKSAEEPEVTTAIEEKASIAQ
ncbi:RnfABCDGE type electron transport complex subunit D [Tengunoibacter tsumagoiensis]|uniref:Na+-transporting NADH:ubiquinone oxidoreductase, subunit NqrB n=1 Tax=Tengunoibacter tsumagoiensis TaxID=2014871 RepID=A0A402A9T3_9CHLR|nr:RnfABCDGE type electron transport complex subunit D [Tengunoibacter tsumagoiensis]GCE15776.1 hypothetical protein KTT_56350 [Tengunoibacter tsumagoiensis]